MCELEECKVECKHRLLVGTPVLVQSPTLGPPLTSVPVNKPKTLVATVWPRSCFFAYGVAVFFGFDNVPACAVGNNPESTSASCLPFALEFDEGHFVHVAMIVGMAVGCVWL